MKKIPFNHKIALENPKAVVKTKSGHLVKNLTRNHIAADPYLLAGDIYFKTTGKKFCTTWMLDGTFREDKQVQEWDLELYVPFTSLWDKIKYYLKKS